MSFPRKPLGNALCMADHIGVFMQEKHVDKAKLLLVGRSDQLETLRVLAHEQ